MIQVRPVEGSANIGGIGYDAENKVLRVRFIKGSEYDFPGVTPEVHRKFLDAPSKGKFFYSEIRNNFQGAKVKSEPSGD